MKKIILVAATVVGFGFGTVSCQDAKFNRGGDSKKGTSDTEPSKPNSTDPSNPNFTDPNDPNNTRTNPDNPGIFTGPNGPGIIGGNGGGILNNPNNPFFEPINPNPFFRSFGGGSIIWHIGDGAWDASSCKFKIDTRSLGLVQGRRFSFYFNVTEDNTNVAINLKYCGVDYIGSQALILGPNGANDVKATKQLDLTRDLLGIFTMYTTVKFAPVTLNRGWHRVQVVSMMQNNDLDNYLVGRVNLDPNKRVDLGEVREE